jgi:hypothetical protein
MSRNKLRVKMSRLKWNEVVHTLNVGADKTLEIKSNSFIFFLRVFLLLVSAKLWQMCKLQEIFTYPMNS